MSFGDLTVSASTCFGRRGFYGLSLWSYPGMTATEIAEEVGRVAAERGIVLLPNLQMRQSTAGALREAGYEITPGGGLRGHVTLVLDELPVDTCWAGLTNLFQAEEPNPIGRRGRS